MKQMNPSRRVGSVARAGIFFVLAPSLLAGCTAAEISTHRGFQASTGGLKGTTYVLKATGNASVTAPDTPRFAKAADFFENQRTQLARQSAAGGGDAVDALGVLLGRKDNRAFASWMQTHYTALFSDRTVAASKVVARIDAQAG